jgi:hypothetical protein
MGGHRICKACGSPLHGNASREHILPQWLHRHIEIAGIHLEHRAADENEVRLLRTHDLNNFVFRSLCKKCNNTWMSTLEADVKPILLQLIDESRTAESLTIEEALVLSRWAFKTAFMILAGQKQFSVPWAMFQDWVAQGTHDPDPAIIFALGNLHVAQGFSYITEGDELPGEALLNLKITLAIRSLLLVVVLPNDSRPRIAGRDHPTFRLLWPPGLAIVDKSTDVDATTPRTYAEFVRCLSGFVHVGLLQLR